jgi:peptidoglycan/xylan/chitin deacetylase (PgdA/CDA1 family)
MTGRFPVLMYHRLESSSCPVDAPAERPWAIPVSGFERQMERLRESGRLGVSMDQIHQTLAAGGNIPAPWVGVTFDDGNRSDHEHALPVLVRFGFRATFFVCGERIDTDLSARHLREMHAAGMHVGSHAMTHRFMTTLSAAEEEGELVRSRATLEALVGAPVEHFAPPGGRWSGRTRRALERTGYVAVSTSSFGFNSAGAASFAYRRLPVVRATSWELFEAMICADRRKLLPGYTRAAILSAARAVLGEGVYGRTRTLGKGH